MSKLNKIIKGIGVLVILLILFRGFLYRNIVNYSKIEARNNVNLTDKVLIKEIDQQIEKNILTIEEIIELSNKITSEKLKFTFSKVPSNPNLIFKTKKANCIGYSSLFNSIGNYILKKQKMTNEYEFNHLVGKLYIFGFNIHNLLSSPFFRDHDFNEIRYKKTNNKKHVDPSLRDYLRIEYVNSK